MPPPLFPTRRPALSMCTYLHRSPILQIPVWNPRQTSPVILLPADESRPRSPFPRSLVGAPPPPPLFPTRLPALSMCTYLHRSPILHTPVWKPRHTSPVPRGILIACATAKKKTPQLVMAITKPRAKLSTATAHGSTRLTASYPQCVSRAARRSEHRDIIYMLALRNVHTQIERYSLVNDTDALCTLPVTAGAPPPPFEEESAP